MSSTSAQTSHDTNRPFETSYPKRYYQMANDVETWKFSEPADAKGGAKMIHINSSIHHGNPSFQLPKLKAFVGISNKDMDGNLINLDAVDSANMPLCIDKGSELENIFEAVEEKIIHVLLSRYGEMLVNVLKKDIDQLLMATDKNFKNEKDEQVLLQKRFEMLKDQVIYNKFKQILKVSETGKVSDPSIRNKVTLKSKNPRMITKFFQYTDEKETNVMHIDYHRLAGKMCVVEVLLAFKSIFIRHDMITVTLMSTDVLMQADTPDNAFRFIGKNITQVDSNQIDVSLPDEMMDEAPPTTSLEDSTPDGPDC